MPSGISENQDDLRSNTIFTVEITYRIIIERFISKGEINLRQLFEFCFTNLGFLRGNGTHDDESLLTKKYTLPIRQIGTIATAYLSSYDKARLDEW